LLLPDGRQAATAAAVRPHGRGRRQGHTGAPGGRLNRRDTARSDQETKEDDPDYRYSIDSADRSATPTPTDRKEDKEEDDNAAFKNHFKDKDKDVEGTHRGNSSSPEDAFQSKKNRKKFIWLFAALAIVD
jgi:hypothetical protein